MATKDRLLAEYRASRYSCPKHAFCIFYVGQFWTGGVLLVRLHRVHPTIPVTRNLDATLSLDSRFVFVLPDSTPYRLDLATAAADGSYVHLIAVGTRPPRFRFAAL